MEWRRNGPDVDKPLPPLTCIIRFRNGTYSHALWNWSGEVWRKVESPLIEVRNDSVTHFALITEPTE